MSSVSGFVVLLVAVGLLNLICNCGNTRSCTTSFLGLLDVFAVR